MQKGLVTVVIPVYNAEKYLDRCISSIVNQTYRNLEILLIDDSSPDNCPKICDDWALKDTRICVIHKKNEGAGFARNTAIDISKGEYICFIDSDDYIHPNTIEETYSLAEKEGSDVVIFGLNSVNKDGDITNTFVPHATPGTYTDKEVVENFLPEYIAPDPNGDGSRKFYMSSCVSLYSLKMINDNKWRYVSERDIISEDVYSLLVLFSFANKVSILPKAYYYYCENTISFSRKYESDRYPKIKYFYTECVKLSQKLGYNENIIHRLSEPYLSYTVGTLKQESVSPKSSKEKKHIIKSIIDDDILQKVLKNNKKDKVSLSRKILFFFIRNKLYNLCYLLLRIKCR